MTIILKPLKRNPIFQPAIIQTDYDKNGRNHYNDSFFLHKYLFHILFVGNITPYSIQSTHEKVIKTTVCKGWLLRGEHIQRLALSTAQVYVPLISFVTPIRLCSGLLRTNGGREISLKRLT